MWRGDPPHHPGGAGAPLRSFLAPGGTPTPVGAGPHAPAGGSAPCTPGPSLDLGLGTAMSTHGHARPVPTMCRDRSPADRPPNGSPPMGSAGGRAPGCPGGTCPPATAPGRRSAGCSAAGSSGASGNATGRHRRDDRGRIDSTIVPGHQRTAGARLPLSLVLTTGQRGGRRHQPPRAGRARQSRHAVGCRIDRRAVAARNDKLAVRYGGHRHRRSGSTDFATRPAVPLASRPVRPCGDGRG